MHFSGNRTVMVMVAVVAFRRGNKGIFCRICRVGQLSWKIAATLGATITDEGGDVHDEDFGFDRFDRGNIADDVLNNFPKVKYHCSNCEAHHANLKEFLIFNQLCENTHGRPTIFWLPGMSWALVNIVPNLRGDEGQQRKYSHLAVTKPTVCSQTHKTDSQESSNPGTIVIRTLGGLSPKYWIIPENCQKIYFSKHLEVGGRSSTKAWDTFKWRLTGGIGEEGRIVVNHIGAT